jgi:nitrogen fixation-related uncharacterized protein
MRDVFVLAVCIAFVALLPLLWVVDATQHRRDDRRVVEQAQRDLELWRSSSRKRTPDATNPWLVVPLHPRDREIRQRVLGPSPRGQP